MNTRKLYLSIASASLIGAGTFFLFRGIMPEGLVFSLAITLSLAAVLALYVFASFLNHRAAKAFIGLTLVFGAIWFGVENDLFAEAVLWAGILFGALDSLSKVQVISNRNVLVDLVSANPKAPISTPGLGES